MITMFAVPVFGIISSVVFLNESFTMIQFAGALATLLGALLAVSDIRLTGHQRAVSSDATRVGNPWKRRPRGRRRNPASWSPPTARQ
jgi:hypothetical protein